MTDRLLKIDIDEASMLHIKTADGEIITDGGKYSDADHDFYGMCESYIDSGLYKSEILAILKGKEL